MCVCVCVCCAFVGLDNKFYKMHGTYITIPSLYIYIKVKGKVKCTLVQAVRPIGGVEV